MWLVLLGRMFTSGSTYPVACAARQSNPLAFIIARKQWNLSEAEEYNETSRADGHGGHHSFRRPSYAVAVGHKRCDGRHDNLSEIKTFLLDDSRFSCTGMGAINCPLLEGSRTFPLPWNLRRTPRVIGWSVGLHRFGVSVLPPMG